MALDRPRVIVHSRASLNGITPPLDDTLENDDKIVPPKKKSISKWIIRYHKVNAILMGSESFVPHYYGPMRYNGDLLDEELLLTHYLPLDVIKDTNRWLCVIDTKGRIEWTTKNLPKHDMTWTILVLVTENTPRQYLSFLREIEIPYLVVGKKFVDLKYAMSELHNVVEIEAIISEASGNHNSALLSADLIDEINIEYIPAIIGGKGGPFLFGSAPYNTDEVPVTLSLKSAQILEDGIIWGRFVPNNPV